MARITDLPPELSLLILEELVEQFYLDDDRTSLLAALEAIPSWGGIVSKRRFEVKCGWMSYNERTKKLCFTSYNVWVRTSPVTPIKLESWLIRLRFPLPLDAIDVSLGDGTEDDGLKDASPQFGVSEPGLERPIESCSGSHSLWLRILSSRKLPRSRTG